MKKKLQKFGKSEDIFGAPYCCAFKIEAFKRKWFLIKFTHA